MSEKIELLSVDEVAEWLKIDRDYLLRLARDKQIKSYKLTKRLIRFSRADVEEFIENGRQ